MKLRAFRYAAIAGTACTVTRDHPIVAGLLGVLFGLGLSLLTDWTCDLIARNEARRLAAPR